MSEYESPFSVAHRQPVVVDKADPRFKKISNYKSKIGSKVYQTERKAPLDIEPWENGWYLRTIESGVLSGFEISNNTVQTYISTDIEMYLNTDFDGILVGENLNYIGDQWRFSKSLDDTLTGYVVSSTDTFIETYVFEDKFAVSSSRVYVDDEFETFIAFAKSEYNNYVSLQLIDSTIISYIKDGSVKEWEKELNVKSGALGCVDLYGRPYIISNDTSDANLIALDTDGNIRWAKTINGLNATGSIIKLLSEAQQYDEFGDPLEYIGYIYVVGYHKTTNNIFILKIDSDGNLVESKEYTSEVILKDASITTDGILLAGQTSAENSKAFVMFIDNVIFEPVWVRLYESETLALNNEVFSGCNIYNDNFYVCGTIFSDTSSRLFAAANEGAFPLGTYDLEDGYSFTFLASSSDVSNLTGISLDTLTIADVSSSHLSFTLPDGIYGDVL